MCTVYFITVSKNSTVRGTAEIKLLLLKNCFSGVFFFSLRKEMVRSIGLRFHQIQYLWDNDFYSVSKTLVNEIYLRPS